MRLLWVATKPPWPSVDGGRLLLAETMDAVARLGHELHLVAPLAGHRPAPQAPVGFASGRCVPHLVRSARRSRLALVPSLWNAAPITIARHTDDSLRDEVARLVESTSFDVVHAEQLQAFAQCRPALERRIPVVLRAQNVESDLWAGVAGCRRGWRPLATRECARVAAYEAAAVRSAAATVALTRRDAGRLARLVGSHSDIHHVAAPFAGAMPAGPALSGSPALVLLASRGWFPGVDGARWFLDSVWPVVRYRLPEARLHLFGLTGRAWRAAGVENHPAPAASIEAFADGATLVVPLRIASGVRMKILEAWARGLPVVATPAAVAGLEATVGRELLVARDGEQFASALGMLAGVGPARDAIVGHARAFLRAHHDPATIAAQLVAIAENVASAARARR
ncbi:MAG TPA: glycosyltransferase [Candidatus Binatia bacterium]